MVDFLKCGHNAGYMYRIRDKGHLHKFCLACLFDKLDFKDLDGKRPFNLKEDVKKKKVAKPETKSKGE